MRLFLSRLHYPLTTLGWGRRIGVWFQGCSIHCPGCISADTWAHGQGETSVEEVMRVISPWMTEADGITISGGEPFEQAEALEALLVALRANHGSEKDVLVYSGQSWEKIACRVKSWQALADVVISDPFLSSSPQSLVWRGSDNQRMHLLTALGRSRYEAWVHAPREALPKALDVFFDSGTVWMAGIPDAGSMEAIQTSLADSGFSSATSSHATSPCPPLPIFA